MDRLRELATYYWKAIDHMPNMHAVLGLPEIQCTFIGYLAPPDAAALARTCHLFFSYGIRQVWGTGDVPIQHLFALIDGITIERAGVVQVREPVLLF